MSFNRSVELCVFTFLLLLLLFRVPSLALNNDGVLLLSFKYAILSDPLAVLQSWKYDDATPCSWNGVTCQEIGNPGSPDMFRVTSLVLPSSQLLGSIPAEVGNIENLRHLDLSDNFLNGSLPDLIFNASELQVLSLSNNEISGELPESVSGMISLQHLNLSENALAGKVPENLTTLPNLTVVSLRSNYFSGSIPNGFDSVEVLDLSSNLLNGSLPLGFGGGRLRYLNVSYNKISGSISPEFAKEIPENATVDLSFNNLTGAIPASQALLNQKTESFSGNVDLCGKPLKNLCSIPSTLSTPPNVSATTSPAIAVIPKTIDPNPATNSPGSLNSTQKQAPSTLKPGTIVGIAVADLAGIAILGMIILYAYQFKKRKALRDNVEKKTEAAVAKSVFESRNLVTTTKTQPASACGFSCLTIKGGEEGSSSEATGSDTDQEREQQNVIAITNESHRKQGALVTVDGETQLELETLLKASAYILGASGSSIVYKAVLENGTAFAVRRIGESCAFERYKDFETQVRAIAKLRHPNLVSVRGFYWGDDEKLVIYDYVSHGSLASSSCRKPGLSSPCHLSLEARLKIARGVARGLAYVHEKKHVHGNIKPSNILLNVDMEPLISDLGLDRLVSGAATSNQKAATSARLLPGSQRSAAASQDHPANASSSHPSAGTSSAGSLPPSPYQSPELLKNLKPNPKWDVYSFGMVLLELLTGRVFSDRELTQLAAGSVAEEKNRVLRLADAAIRTDVASREDAMVTWFKLAFSCVSFAPQKRPSMKEAVQAMGKMSGGSH